MGLDSSLQSVGTATLNPAGLSPCGRNSWPSDGLPFPRARVERTLLSAAFDFALALCCRNAHRKDHGFSRAANRHPGRRLQPLRLAGSIKCGADTPVRRL
jgi:hypothetical protein